MFQSAWRLKRGGTDRIARGPPGGVGRVGRVERVACLGVWVFGCWGFGVGDWGLGVGGWYVVDVDVFGVSVNLDHCQPRSSSLDPSSEYRRSWPGRVCVGGVTSLYTGDYIGCIPECY